jgi:hypothetical protein
MSGRRLVALFAVVSALVGAGAASAAVAPKITAVTDAQGNTSIAYTQSAGDDSLAILRLYVPYDYVFNSLTKQPSEVLATATARGVAADLGGQALTFTGSLNAATASTSINYAGSTQTLAALSASCTGSSAANPAYWSLSLSASTGQTVQLPAFVESILPPDPIGDYHQIDIAICMPPPDVPPGAAARASYGLKLTDLSLVFQAFFSVPPEFHVWHAVALPYGAGTGRPNAAGVASAETQERVPKTLTLAAKANSGAVIVSGRLTEGGKGIVGVSVDVLSGTKVVGKVQTKARGYFAGTLRAPVSGRLSASADVPTRSLPSCVQAIFANCVTATVSGFTARSAAVRVKR